MATVPAVPLPAQVVLCLGETLPGIGAEFSLAPAVKTLNTQAVGNSMVAVEMTLTFIVRLVQTDTMPVRPATSEPVTIPSASPPMVPATNEGLKFGNGTPVNMNSEAEITTYNNFIKIKKSSTSLAWSVNAMAIRIWRQLQFGFLTNPAMWLPSMTTSGWKDIHQPRVMI